MSHTISVSYVANKQPVMLREPSFKPPVNVSEDGEVGASDDDEDDEEESETEVEGGEHGHGDSEDETETEGKGKGKKKAVPLRQRLTGTGPAGKGKGKQKTAASPGAGIAPVTEEPGKLFFEWWIRLIFQICHLRPCGRYPLQVRRRDRHQSGHVSIPVHLVPPPSRGLRRTIIPVQTRTELNPIQPIRISVHNLVPP